jgi:tetratricopeptide (TPR) repeat protein
MRPLRALAGLIALTFAWLWWRAPALVVDLDRYSAAAHVAQARAAHASGNAAEAMKELRVALVQEPTNETARALWRMLTAARAAPAQIAAAVLPPPVSPIVAIRQKPPVMRRAAVARLTPPAPPPPPVRIEIAATLAVRPPPAPPTGVSSAEAGYAALALHDRRTAAAAFRRALVETPGDPRAAQWRRQLSLLEKRWSGETYALFRGRGVTNLAATPVLGAGQSGGQLRYALDPLARRPLLLEGRLTTPNTQSRDNLQGALGVTWAASPRFSLTAERLVRIGGQSRSAWTLRAAGGAEHSGPIALDAYAEAGVVGVRNTAAYAAAQGHVTHRIGPVSIGAGAWASVQHDARTVGRFEAGPSLRFRHGALDLSADYRLRLAGNAAPGSGPALTLAAYF